MTQPIHSLLGNRSTGLPASLQGASASAAQGAAGVGDSVSLSPLGLSAAPAASTGASADPSAQLLPMLMSLMSMMLTMLSSLFGGNGANPAAGSQGAANAAADAQGGDASSTGSTASAGGAASSGTGTTASADAGQSTQSGQAGQSGASNAPRFSANSNVVMLEPSAQHNSQVLNVLDDYVDGTKITRITPSVPNEYPAPTTMAELGGLAETDYLSSLKLANQGLQDVLGQGQDAARVVNMSFGRPATTTIELVKSALENNGTLRSQFLQSNNLPANTASNNPNYNLAVVNFVTNQLSNSQNVAQTRNQYANLTQQAADRGIVVVVASGNDGQLIKDLHAQGINLDPIWGMNNLALSSSVISVGAIDDKDTASTSDDVVAGFSSQGNAQFRPTLMADGVNVHGEDGTSFAAPQVAGAVQRIISANPNLGFAQIRQLLLNSSSYAVGGVPVLNMTAAERAARGAA